VLGELIDDLVLGELLRRQEHELRDAGGQRLPGLPAGPPRLRGVDADRLGRPRRRQRGDLVALEGDLSAVYVSDRGSGPESVVVQRELVGDVLARYQAMLSAIDRRRYGARVRDALAGVRRRLGELAVQRRAIDARGLDLGASLRWYSDTVETLIGVEDVAADEVDDRGVARDLEAYTSLSRAKEQAAQQRGAIAGALASGRDETADTQRLAAAGALESSTLGRFRATATAPQQALYSRTLTGPDVERANSLEATALAAEPGGRCRSSSTPGSSRPRRPSTCCARSRSSSRTRPPPPAAPALRPPTAGWPPTSPASRYWW
jgi:hypothetical protein